MASNEFNMTSDADLEAIVARGEEAQTILDTRARVERLMRMARTPLTVNCVLAAATLNVTRDRKGDCQVLYRNVPVNEIAAACPIPPGTMSTINEVMAVLDRWNDWIDAREVSDGE